LLDHLISVAHSAPRTETLRRAAHAWLLESRMPEVELIDALIDVDNETNFLHHFLQSEQGRRLPPAIQRRNVLAALVAVGCNIGPTRMAAASGLSVWEISQAADWYLTGDALKAAGVDLVNYAIHLPMSHLDGLNAVQGARLCGAFPLVGVDFADNKLAFAQTLGASHTINATLNDPVGAIRELTAGRGAEFTFVAVGSTQAIDQAWQALAPGGTCVVVGAPPTGETVAINPVSLYRDEKRLTGSRYGSSRPLYDFPLLVDLYLAGKLELDALITRRYALDEINEAHRALGAGENMRGLILF
jgi:hypothetical protein